MALVSEAAELMAHFRWSEQVQDVAVLGNAQSLKEIRHEVADVLLLLAEFANVAGIDMAQAMQEKMAINAERYSVEKSAERRRSMTGCNREITRNGSTPARQASPPRATSTIPAC